jgi:monoamine oxidase
MNKYDYAIIGGGISGLYAAYKLNKKYPNKKIILYEKNNYFGGRVKGYNYKTYHWEEGAGRFNSNHKLLIELIEELKLKNKIIKIGAKTQFLPIDSNKYSKSVMIKSAYDYIDEIINITKKDKVNNLNNFTFEKYCRIKLGDEITEYVLDSYGYYVELTVMNLTDAVRMFEIDMNPNIQFYTLQGGMHLIIDKLIKILNRKRNIKLYTDTELIDLLYNNNKFILKIKKDNKKLVKIVKIVADKCILAIPRYGLEKLKILNKNVKIMRMIRSVVCKPLCRVYSVFKNIWFDNIIKTTTDSKIRYIIPIDNKKGVIMSSYTDGKYAEYINKYFNTYGYEKFNRMLVKELKKVFKDKDIDTPLYTHISYWDCGAGYWRRGVNSKSISSKIIKPYNNMDLYIVGENYSLSQAWIEGGLETVNKLLIFE